MIIIALKGQVKWIKGLFRFKNPWESRRCIIYMVILRSGQMTEICISNLALYINEEWDGPLTNFILKKHMNIRSESIESLNETQHWYMNPQIL
jgi:hypothetical protein